MLTYYQQKFQYIHVDEYQDTNGVQYAITKLLASKYRNLMVVGDDDQSFTHGVAQTSKTSWAFEKDYEEAVVVKLEQNYRSTGHILAAANAVLRTTLTASQSASSLMREMARKFRCIRHLMSVMRARGLAPR